MSYLVAKPEDRFSRDEAHLSVGINSYTALCFQLVNEVKQNLPFKDDSNNKENVGANPMDVVKMEESLDQQMEKTKFGPKAVMKKGVIGNFEPEYHIKAGPGGLP